MSTPATREDIDEVVDLLRGFMQQVDDRFNQVDERFEQVDDRLQQIDFRFASIETQLADVKTEVVELKESHNHLLNTIDGFIARIDKYETELAARDRQFECLLAWARKVSKKTGIPLENL